MPVKIGTSGFTLLQHFYAPDVKATGKLQAYARVFSTVEINSTFYHLPRASTVAGWLEQVPEDFVFAFKVWRQVTHAPTRHADLKALGKWFEAFPVTDTRHLMLFQFPHTYIYRREEFTALLAVLPVWFRYAFEFRHASWCCPEVYDALQEHDATMVWSDAPMHLKTGKPMWPKVDLKEAPFAFLRMHGSRQLYASSYTEEELMAVASLIREKEARGKDVFVYFNNDAKGHAAANALSLERLLRK